VTARTLKIRTAVLALSAVVGEIERQISPMR